MPPRCQNRKIRSGSVALLRLSIFFMRNIQKLNAPIGKIFPKNHCHFSELRIYWEIYRSFLPAPQAGELSSCTAASGGKQAGKAKLPSPPFFAVFLFCRYSYFQRCLLRIFALPALLSFRCLRFRHRCRTGFYTSPASLIGPIFPVSDSVIGMDPAFSRRCYHLRSCFFSVPIICRYFLFSGIDSSPAPESFFSAGVPFLDFREGCFYPFGFLRCRFSVCIRRFCPVTAPFSDLGASRFLSSFCPALDTFLSSRRWCLPY